MCTVTLIARQHGYCLGMNRDEQLTRPSGLPPRSRRVNGRTVVSPSEPAGGTWIALNDTGVCWALINWYGIENRVTRGPVSRGVVVESVGALTDPRPSHGVLKGLPLGRMNAFRLIGVFPVTRDVVEWRWDREQLQRIDHRWGIRQWASSGFDEPEAQRMRHGIFRRALRQKSAGSLAWLRRLHRSHAPESGPFSICMHRAGAATVSYTEILVAPNRTWMRYHPGPPCTP